MNRSKKYMMVAALATLSCGAMAQGLNTGYFIDGYTFRHNLNPAYGNDQNYVPMPRSKTCVPTSAARTNGP